MTKFNNLSQIDRRDELILGFIAGFAPLLGLAAMLY